jgi:hypothetical protein
VLERLSRVGAGESQSLVWRVGSWPLLAHSHPAGHFFKTLRSSLGLSFSAVVKLSGHPRAMSASGHLLTS